MSFYNSLKTLIVPHPKHDAFMEAQSSEKQHAPKDASAWTQASSGGRSRSTGNAG